MVKSFDLLVNDFYEAENKNLQISSDKFLLNKLSSINFTKSDFINVKQFISKYVTYTNWGYPILNNSTKNNEIDLNDLLKCFVDADLGGGEINQKDCY